MPYPPIVVGPFTSLYVGDAPPASAVLTYIPCPRTKGSVQRYSLPQAYEDVVGGHVQSGRATSECIFRFYGLDPLVLCLAMGNSITSSANPIVGSSFTHYTVLLVSPNTLAKESILIPNCETDKEFDFNREKTSVTETPIRFITTNRNRYKFPFYIDTLAALLAKTEMSGRSPF